MIPCEKFSDGPNYLVPGSGVPATHEGLLECKGGCGVFLWSPGYCRKCGEEVAALRQMWDFEKHRRRRAPLTLTVWVELIVALGAGGYFFWTLCEHIANWICGGMN